MGARDLKYDYNNLTDCRLLLAHWTGNSSCQPGRAMIDGAECNFELFISCVHSHSTLQAAKPFSVQFTALFMHQFCDQLAQQLTCCWLVYQSKGQYWWHQCWLLGGFNVVGQPWFLRSASAPSSATKILADPSRHPFAAIKVILLLLPATDCG